MRLMLPSVEFSIGTTPYCTCPASTCRNTSSIDAHGCNFAWPPNCLIAASSLNVPCGPRIGDRDAVLERAAGRHDFRVKPRQRRRRQRPPVARRHAPQHLGFALGTVLGAALGVPDGLRQRRALAQQVDDAVVERIDTGANFLERVGHEEIPGIRGFVRIDMNIKSIRPARVTRARSRARPTIPAAAGSAP